VVVEFLPSVALERLVPLLPTGGLANEYHFRIRWSCRWYDVTELAGVETGNALTAPRPDAPG
jgi:hypothetical protein